jgi:hypothetical protein
MADLKSIGISRDSVKTLFKPDTVEAFVFAWLEEKVNQTVSNLDASGREASLTLKQSVRFAPVPVEQGSGFRFQFLMEDYWIYVNDGRQAGKMPPIKPLVEWIYLKPSFKAKIGGTRSVLKGMAMRKLGDIQAPSSVLSAAYGMAINLKKKGIPATNFYSSVVNEASLADLKAKIGEYFKKDVQIHLVKLAEEANRK